MTWGEFKKKVEFIGVKDGDELQMINMGGIAVPVFNMNNIREPNPFENFGEENPK